MLDYQNQTLTFASAFAQSRLRGCLVHLERAAPGSLFPRRPCPYLPVPMNLTLIAGLVVACAVLMFLERRGLKTTLSLNMKGDVKRETRWVSVVM